MILLSLPWCFSLLFCPAVLHRCAPVRACTHLLTCLRTAPATLWVLIPSSPRPHSSLPLPTAPPCHSLPMYSLPPHSPFSPLPPHNPTSPAAISPTTPHSTHLHTCFVYRMQSAYLHHHCVPASTNHHHCHSMQVHPCPCPGEPQSSKETEFDMLVIPSRESFLVRWSQLPLDGVSYSLRSFSGNVAVDLGDNREQTVSLQLFLYTRIITCWLLSLCIRVSVLIQRPRKENWNEGAHQLVKIILCYV